MKLTTIIRSALALLLAMLVPFGGMLMSQPAELPARAFTNVTVHLADGSKIENASVVWRNGIIEAVGRNISIPFDARVIDGGDSLHVYPGFINGYSTWGAPDRSRTQDNPDVPGFPTYERAGIQSDRQAHHFIEDKPVFKQALKQGFAASGLGLNGFMLPGTVGLYHLSDKNIEDHVFARDIAQVFQFQYGRGAYPSTLMGVMARFRQLFHDAQALRDHHRLFASGTANASISLPRHDAVLESLFPVMDRQMPVFAVADSPEDVRRMIALKNEFGYRLVIVSGTEAGLVASELAAQNIPVLVSIPMPDKPDWMKEDEKKKPEEPEEKEDASLEATADEKSPELTEEEKNFRERQAVARQQRLNNIRQLLDAGVNVGFSMGGMRMQDFKKNITTLLEAGYTETELLRMFTSSTAAILGHGNRLGNIQPGMAANMAVFHNGAFARNGKAVYTVSGGILYNLETLE